MDQINPEVHQQPAEADPNASTEHAVSHLNSLADLITGSGAAPPTYAQQQAQDAPNNTSQPDDAAEEGPATKKLKTETAAEDGDATASAPQPSSQPATDDTASNAILPGIDQQAALLNPEQLAAFTQSMPLVTPEILAAAMQSTTGPDGQPLPMLGDFSQLVDPNSLNQFAGINNIGMDVISSLPPEQLQAILQGNSLSNIFMPGIFGTDPNAANYKNWWDEKDEQELMRIVSDTQYRIETLGTDELDWSKLETHFNRSQNALRKKYWMLTKGKDGTPGGRSSGGPTGSQGSDGMGDVEGNAAAAAAIQSALMPALDQQAIAMAMAAAVPHGILPSPPPPAPTSGKGTGSGRAERKNWTDAEYQDMVKIVSDPMYRAQCGLVDGEEEISWERLAMRFSCSVQTAKRKYRNTQEQMVQGNGVMPEKTKRQHFRKSVPYRWMIVSAISKIPGLEATAPQIFENIEADPELCTQLDTRIMPGTKHVPRWKIQVRKVLSADHIFINTGIKQKHETIWRLDPVALQDTNAERQRQRAGLPPINIGSNDLPAVPALVNPSAPGDPMSAALMQQFNEQSLNALLQNPQALQAFTFTDPSQFPQLMGLEGATMMDPATLAAMMTGSGIDPQALTMVGLPGQEEAMAAAMAAAQALGGGVALPPGMLEGALAAVEGVGQVGEDAGNATAESGPVVEGAAAAGEDGHEGQEAKEEGAEQQQQQEGATEEQQQE